MNMPHSLDLDPHCCLNKIPKCPLQMWAAHFLEVLTLPPLISNKLSKICPHPFMWGNICILSHFALFIQFPENYASIHRRCSKSSVGGGSAASVGFLGPSSMGSPHLLRADRANSLAPSNGNERRKAEMMPMNGGMGKQQQFEAMSQRDQQRLFDGLAVEQQQKMVGMEGRGNCRVEIIILSRG